jgi:hypothetical protein
MKNQIEIVKDIADGMYGIGGIPNNEEFYSEFNSRVVSILNIKDTCRWKSVDVGMFGCNDYVWQTSCGQEFDSDKTRKMRFCPNCGKRII